jgi:3-hydroxyisobutyrate dehydrogenase-like beta-hydroxyacid dehydrogenase
VVEEGNTMTGQVLGFIGLGRMGGPLTRRLLAAGYDLTVFDISREALSAAEQQGAVPAASPAEAAARAEIVLTSLPTPQIVQEVALGEEGIVRGGRANVLIDLSTTGREMATRVAAGLAEHGIQWVDSPVSGGVAGAVRGSLAVMVSCPRPTFEAIEPIVANFGRPFFVGEEPGLAQVAKLANNLLAAAALVVSSEAFAMGVKAGVDPRILCEIVNAGTGRNSATQDKFPRAVLPGTFDFGFATGLLYKDVRLCLDEAEALGVPMVTGALVRQILAITQAEYGAESDFTSIARVVERWAGVEIRDRQTAPHAEESEPT